MRQVSGVLVLCVGLASAIGCASGTGPSAGSQAKVLSKLDDGVWQLAVDRAVRAGNQVTGLPASPLPESAFAPVSGGPTYRLEVSESGRRIVVTEPRMVGRLEESTSAPSTYQLVEGTFAGGRIVVWQASNGLQAELTIYGSGVPIVRSERGALRKAK